MENNLYIQKERKLLPVEDYHLLRSEGLKYIEQLASKIWTDYNTHDPGITIMEALCYAITELGYRTSFNIKDLVSNEDGKIDVDQAFFSAKTILHNNPLTITDYRKILCDVIGVRNAFLYPYRDEDFNVIGEPEQEVKLYAHCEKNQLVYEETDHPVKLHGLYHVVLDFEESDEFGDLNTGNIVWQFATEELSGVKFQLLFPNWKEVNYRFIIAPGTVTADMLSDISVTLLNKKWTISFNLTAGETLPITFYAVALLRKSITDIEAAVSALLNDANVIAEIFSLYKEKIRSIVTILTEAKNTLHLHRNLCEDIIKIETICTQEVAFCADVEVAPEADIEEVYANIIFQLENYLNPEVKFYSLAELLNDKTPVDEIFEGPVLQHGFIKSDEIKATAPRTKIYVSDVISFIMDTPGVLSVKNVLFTKYNDKGVAELPSQPWCLEISQACKAVLNAFKSKVLFFKGKLPFKANYDETFSTLKYLHGLEQQKKLKGTADDLTMPRGDNRDLGQYVSVQYEFPLTYGVGKADLPAAASNERKAQAKQLKAYLLFFDQLLANFFSQLNHSKELFSLNKNISQTYFAQFISDANVSKDLYVNETDLEKTFDQPNPADTPEIIKKRESLMETSDMFYDRRNRFLDHLTSRFAESFNEYVLMLYTYKNADEYSEIDVDELLEDKIDFLKDYPEISSGRGKAFNYLGDTWNTVNVSGFEKRIARLAGIDDFSRRYLFCLKNIEIQKTSSSPAKYFFRVINADGNILLQSIKEYDSYSELLALVQKIPAHIIINERYQLIDVSATEFSFQLMDETNTALAESGTIYPDAEARENAINNIIEEFKADCPAEGMHLIEHILLRPHFTPPVIAGEQPEDVYKLLEVCLNEDCAFCGEEDPYSFHISLILPYWHERFESVEFRKYFEVIARTEAPAHCMIKVCWVSNTLMNEFEHAYREWLEALKDYEAELLPLEEKKNRLREAGNVMTEIIKKLHSEYPEARLHDCDTGVTNPVLLGSTILGTF